VWYLDYGQPTLFSQADEFPAGGRRTVVVDSNVFFDLQDPLSAKTEEARALQADWLSDLIELCVTEEIFSEIHRAKDAAERQRRRAFVSNFRILKPSTEEESEKFEQLRVLIPGTLSDNDRSDLLHLAKAIASGAHYFVTRDEGVLERSAALDEKFGIGVLRPTDLIIKIDETYRAAEYSPARLAGTLSPIQRVSQDKIATLSRHFQAFSRREPKHEFVTRIRSTLTDPKAREAFIISDADGEEIALYVLDWSSPHEVTIPVLRIRDRSRAASLCRYIVWRTLSAAREKARELVRIGEDYLPDGAAEVLGELSFAPDAAGKWTKINIDIVGTFESAGVHLSELAKTGPSPATLINVAQSHLRDGARANSPEIVARLERTFWPLKLTDGVIENFIVPIRAHWAAQLFDEGLANQLLFGSEDRLAISVANVYYRAPSPRLPRAPSRVLWYVSDDDHYAGTMAIRAVSHVTQVRVGPAKALFSQFRRLGVYEWKDVAKVVKKHGEVLAFVFTHTELFRSPVPRSEVMQFLREETGRENPLVGPVAVPSRCFFKIYKRGMEMKPTGARS
jgi:predicted nucleic acid-binding protein